MLRSAFQQGAAMSFQESLEVLTRDERFKATVYAMNTLLIQKGVYSAAEFEGRFVEWAEKQRTEKRADAPAALHSTPS
jgi:hypothetical protein